MMIGRSSKSLSSATTPGSARPPCTSRRTCRGRCASAFWQCSKAPRRTQRRSRSTWTTSKVGVPRWPARSCTWFTLALTLTHTLTHTHTHPRTHSRTRIRTRIHTHRNNPLANTRTRHTCTGTGKGWLPPKAEELVRSITDEMSAAGWQTGQSNDKPPGRSDVAAAAADGGAGGAGRGGETKPWVASFDLRHGELPEGVSVEGGSPMLDQVRHGSARKILTHLTSPYSALFYPASPHLTPPYPTLPQPTEPRRINIPQAAADGLSQA